MRLLFIHQNFPGQFKHLAPALVARGHEVSTLTLKASTQTEWHGVRWRQYAVQRGTTPAIHPWVGDIETKTIRGEACWRAAMAWREEGYVPDAIVAHPGWGESLFLKRVWPQARLGLYCEYHYRHEGGDVGFDPEFPVTDPAQACRLQMKNLNFLAHTESADALLAPTHWQADTFPRWVRERMDVIHDGIDTQVVRPDPTAQLRLNRPGATPLVLGPTDEVITFVNRNLEPYRGFHVLMRMVPALLRRHPRARVLVVGGDGVSYGALPDPQRHAGARGWREVMQREIRPQMPDRDWERVHFLGQIPYPQFLALLQVSRVHVYWTYPFVLSWSVLEAMSAGCTLVASDTGPLHEVILDGVNGRLLPFFDVSAWVDTVSDLLNDAPERQRLGAAARETVVTRYDLQRICLPAQIRWVERLASGGLDDKKSVLS